MFLSSWVYIHYCFRSNHEQIANQDYCRSIRFWFQLVQLLTFFYHFFAETCRTSLKFLPFVDFFLTFKSSNWYLWYLCQLIPIWIKHFNYKRSCVRTTISNWGPTQQIQSPLKMHHACTVLTYLETRHQLPLIGSRVVYFTETALIIRGRLSLCLQLCKSCHSEENLKVLHLPSLIQASSSHFLSLIWIISWCSPSVLPTY